MSFDDEQKASREDKNISSGSSDSTDPNDENWDDWVEDPIACKSLFDDLELPSVGEALRHDLEKHKFDLSQISRILSMSNIHILGIAISICNVVV